MKYSNDKFKKINWLYVVEALGLIAVFCFVGLRVTPPDQPAEKLPEATKTLHEKFADARRFAENENFEEGRREMVRIYEQSQSSSVEPSERNRIATQYGRFLFDRAEFEQAAQVLRQAVDGFLQAKNFSAIAIPGYFLTASEVEINDFDNAIKHEELALGFQRKLTNAQKDSEGALLKELCIAYVETGNLNTASKVSDQLIAITDSRRIAEFERKDAATVARARAFATKASIEAQQRRFASSKSLIEQAAKLGDSVQPGSKEFEVSLRSYVRSLKKAGLSKEAQLYNRKLDDELDLDAINPITAKTAPA